MIFRLRGHHLLCLVGYRGMGYSKEYVENMTQTHQTLRQYPDTKVQLVTGPDDLCIKFPENLTCHCLDREIIERDANIRAKLGLEEEQTVTWAEIEQRIRKYLRPHDIGQLCSTCSWRAYGVCEEGIDDIRAGRGLRVVQ